MNRENVIGRKFSRLTVIERIAKTRKVICKCECGVVKEYYLENIKRASTKSCGCLNIELAIPKIRKAIEGNIKHGMSHMGRRHPIYNSWQHMKDRVLNPRSANYKYYGGRGIKICKTWLNFENFKKDMEETWEKGLTIERVDNDGDYCKENCKWADRKTQNRNHRGNRFYKGLCFADWEKKKKWKEGTITKRVNRGWPVERAVSEEPRRMRKHGF